MGELLEIRRQIYKIIERLKFDDSVIKAGNSPTLHPEDRHEMIDELDRLRAKKHSLEFKEKE